MSKVDRSEGKGRVSIANRNSKFGASDSRGFWVFQIGKRSWVLALTGIEHVVAGGEGIPMHMLTFPVTDVHPMALALVRRKELVTIKSRIH